MSPTRGTIPISADQLLWVDGGWDVEGAQGFSERTKVSKGLLDNIFRAIAASPLVLRQA